MRFETPHFKTVSAKDLLTRPCNPIEYTIDKILPHGLFLLSGKAKIAKSWLTLDISNCVMNGDALWKYPATKGDVLYLALEDNDTRLQERLGKITTRCDLDSPTDITFVTEAYRIDCGLTEQLAAFLDSHPETRLVIIDSLYQVRSFGKGSGTYNGDYYDMDSLREVIKSRKLSMIVISHNHKSKDADPLDRVYGSVGLTGAVDGILIMEKKRRTGDKVTLTITNRDTESHQFELMFNRETCRLDFIREIIGDEQDEDEQMFALIDFLLDENPAWKGTATELCTALNSLDKTQTLSPITLARNLNGRQEYLRDKYHIICRFTRTKSAKLIELSRENDDADSTGVDNGIIKPAVAISEKPEMKNTA